MANNKIQIKRSVANAVVTGLSNGELAFTQASNTLWIGLPDGSGTLSIGGARNPGVLTANQALVTNNSSAIDKIIVANAVLTSISANGSSGSNGQVLVTNGSAIYWGTGTSGANTQVQFNDGGVANGSAGFTFVKTSNSLNVSNTINTNNLVAETSLSAGSNALFVNTSTVVLDPAAGLMVSGSIGTSGQVLVSNGTTAVWTDPTAESVTSVTAGDDTISIGGNSTAVTVSTVLGNGVLGTDSIHINAKDGLVSNTGGLYVVTGTGVYIDGNGNVAIGQDVYTNSNVTFANVVTTLLTVNGNTEIGTSSSDVLTINSEISGNLVPTTNNAYDLGTNLLRWNTIHAANIHGGTGYFDNNLQVGGDLLITGNVVTTNVSTINVENPLVYLAANNTSDLLDIGFVGQYDSGTGNVHTGVFRHAATDEYYIFKGYELEPYTNNTIDISDASFQLATLNAFLYAGGLEANTTYVGVTANSTCEVAIVANTLTLSDPLAATSGGTGQNTYTSGDLLVANSGNALSKLSLGTSGKVLQSNGSALVYDILDGGTF